MKELTYKQFEYIWLETPIEGNTDEFKIKTIQDIMQNKQIDDSILKHHFNSKTKIALNIESENSKNIIKVCKISDLSNVLFLKAFIIISFILYLLINVI